MRAWLEWWGEVVLGGAQGQAKGSGDGSPLIQTADYNGQRARIHRVGATGLDHRSGIPSGVEGVDSLCHLRGGGGCAGGQVAGGAGASEEMGGGCGAAAGVAGDLFDSRRST